jgi:hypothetical protein
MSVKTMKTKLDRPTFNKYPARCLMALAFVALLAFSDLAVFARPEPQPTSALAQDAQDAPKIPNDQLDSLVAPIALYPDPLLTQTLVASTYPLEIMQLQQWLGRNQNLKDKALSDAVSKQPWDPSVQAMAALPDVVKRLADDIQWATDLGNAFLAQQSDVMDAVQRMRKKAQGAGALKSNEQLKVETEVVESKTVIVVQQANPQVVYVPSYNPTVVYGPPVYPYPPIYYPTGAMIAARAITFGAGIAIGAAWGGGGWGWNTGWGRNDINVNINNNFNRNYNNISGGNRINNIQGGNRVNNIQGGNRNNIGSGNRWQHNPQHRGGAPYANRDIANRFGGAARGDSLANRQSGARQQLGRQGGNLPSTRDANRGSLGDRAGGLGNRAGVSDRASNTGNRGDGLGDRGAGGGNRGGLSDRAGDRGSFGGNRGGGGGDRIGSRDVQRSSGSRDRSALGGGGFGGFNGASARDSSSRGASSMGGGGFGGRGGGGGGGFGGRGGGGGGGFGGRGGGGRGFGGRRR